LPPEEGWNDKSAVSSSSVSRALFRDAPTGTDVQLSAEHSDFRWCDYETSVSMLEWESNRNALEEAESVPLWVC